MVDILSLGSSWPGTCSEEDEMSGLGVVGTSIGLLLAFDACSQETTIQQWFNIVSSHCLAGEILFIFLSICICMYSFLHRVCLRLLAWDLKRYWCIQSTPKISRFWRLRLVACTITWLFRQRRCREHSSLLKMEHPQKETINLSVHPDTIVPTLAVSSTSMRTRLPWQWRSVRFNCFLLAGWNLGFFLHLHMMFKKHKGVEQFVVSVFPPTNVGGPGIWTVV